MWIHLPKTPRGRSDHEKRDNRDPENPMVEVGKIRCLAQYIHMFMFIILLICTHQLRKSL